MNETRENTIMDRESRDLLIELRTKVEGIGFDVKELKDNTASRLARVEQDKLDRTEAIRLQNEALGKWVDTEKRMDKLAETVGKSATAVTQIQTWGAAGVLLLGVVQFAINFFF